MNQAPSYQIEIFDQIVFADIRGEFDFQATFLCFYKMYSAVRSVQGKPWGLVVDMRGWSMTESAFASETPVELHLDRRNQVAECWLVDHETQGNHIVHYPKLAGIPISRTSDVDFCLAWFDNYQLSTHRFKTALC